MTLTLALIALVAAGLAYANGANDVSKGVATLVGSGVTDYRRAIRWGSAWTAVGGLLGALFAGAMLATLGGGLLVEGARPSLSAALAALAGATSWVLLATWRGLPVSTTHAIVGSLLGVAASAYGPGAIRWAALGAKVVLPLLLTPLLSLLLTSAILCALRGRATRRPRALQATLGPLHWLTSGATSLARGMNDAPKIVALSLAAFALGEDAAAPAPLLYAVVTLAMVAGSLMGGLRVTRVLAESLTPMDDREGFVANLVTAALVTTGAVFGLPMSTTHVASGGIFGAGAQRGTLDRRSFHDILLAWVVTLPAAALLGAGVYAAAAALG